MPASYENLPQKRIAAGVLFFNDQNRLLIVKPVYRNHWSVPGGVVEENESPLDGCIREIKEEIDLQITKENLQFLCLDYRYPSSERPESLQFVFYGGILSPEQIQKIKLPPDELAEYKFSEIEEALFLLSESMRLRLPKIFKLIGKNSVYLENGE